MSSVRVSQHGAEVFYEHVAASPTTITGVGVSQYGVEVFVVPSDYARVSQYGVEVFVIASGDESESAGGGGSSPVTTTFGYAV